MKKIRILLPVLMFSMLIPSSNMHAQQETDKTGENGHYKEMVLKALNAVFIEGDTSAVDKYWTKDYIQHNPLFPNGSDVIKKFAENKSERSTFEPGLIMEDGDFVMIHSRYSGMAPKPMIIVDIFRIEDGKIAEHWDIMQEEVPAEKTISGNPMFPIQR